MSKSAIGWLLITLGVIGLVIFGVKMSIIGYYPSEIVPFLALMVVSVGLGWLGNRFRKQAAVESDRGNG
ncbi:MAG: hypothetical protein JF592_14190 [Microbacterium sp.]|uniref:hypothetical protein n=1 Tax=Microbacterium sp. TaxID=51671 RepID=UPI001E096168|nr:hypothetical protein [Microbacterium sp.]MBW8763709.1 hypothetical protein [Microbacterium sp.]